MFVVIFIFIHKVSIEHKACVMYQNYYICLRFVCWKLMHEGYMYMHMKTDEGFVQYSNV